MAQFFNVRMSRYKRMNQYFCKFVSWAYHTTLKNSLSAKLWYKRMCPKSRGFKQVIHQLRSSCSFFRDPLDIREGAANVMAGKYITTSPEMRLQIQKSKSFTFLKVGNSRLSVISQLKAAGGIQQTGHLCSLEVELYIHHSFNCERNQSSNRMLNVSNYISFSDVRF